MNVENGLFSKTKKREKRLMFEPKEVACCICHKNLFEIVDRNKRYCVRCLYQQYDFEEKLKMASIATFPVGIMTLKNGRAIPFLWDENEDYADLLEIKRMNRQCIEVFGLEGQFKYVLAHKVVNIKPYRDWEWNDEDMEDDEADQEVI